MPKDIPIIQDPGMSNLGESLSNFRPSWDEYFMLLAKLAASRSSCFSRPVGAIIVRDRRVLSTGYNGAPPGTWHCTDKKQCYWRQPENHVEGIEPKDLSRAVHAEINAIAQAARQGISINGGTIYTTLSPCTNCFKALLSSGITRVFYEHNYDFNNHGGDQYLTNYYQEFKEQIEVQQLTLTPQTQETAVRFISGTTSQRRHNHY